jgi:hypothetical protein
MITDRARHDFVLALTQIDHVLYGKVPEKHHQHSYHHNDGAGADEREMTKQFEHRRYLTP